MDPDGRDGTSGTRAAVLRALTDGERFVLVTHENADGDALGSLVGMHGILTALGKDAVMLMSADEFPLPYEYGFLPLDDVVTEVPADLAARAVVFLDCGNIDRNPLEAVRVGGPILNVDHHHDNTRFGTLNLVDPDASCTAEIVWDLMQSLGVAPTLQIAEALYAGLVTDTGRFMYENTGPRAHAMAAELMAVGVESQEIYRHLFEGMPESKLHLLARALEGVVRYDDGRLTFAWLTREDFEQTGAEESYTEGIIDHLRAVRDTKVAALVRERVDQPGRTKVSLRAADGTVDVSVIARAAGGGGHRQAAGFSTPMSREETVALVREGIAAQVRGDVVGRP
ncbi:MAG: bifunctional oligoribonuclease/PAP phosphatase NrnA [Solirubrobacterales bacterium]|nr:bifunctional oligoribonuclease/PAP phosphatase NrnA [Solirubrobacterales bacterium]